MHVVGDLISFCRALFQVQTLGHKVVGDKEGSHTHGHRDDGTEPEGGPEVVVHACRSIRHHEQSGFSNRTDANQCCENRRDQAGNNLYSHIDTHRSQNAVAVEAVPDSHTHIDNQNATRGA